MTHTKNNRRTKRRSWPVITDPHYTAARIVEAVDDAWYGAGRPCSDDAICLGVVAALSLLRAQRNDLMQMIPGPHGPGGMDDPAPLQITCRGRDMPVGVDLRDFLMACPDYWITKLLTEIWTFFWIVRPELAMYCGPLADWLNGEGEPDRHIAAAAARVARAAVKAGLLNECGGGWSLAQQTDILGRVYTEMRSASARRGRGEFYSPEGLCELMAEMSLAGRGGALDLKPGMSIMEPAAGTGGMFLGAMKVMVRRGLDPADYVWFGNDISAVPVAALAVNCHIWGLGRCVVLGVADSLADPDWYRKAIRDQQAAIGHRDALWQGAQWLAILRQFDDPKPREDKPLPDWFAKLIGADDDALFQVQPDIDLGARRSGGRNGTRRRPAPEPDPAGTLF